MDVLTNFNGAWEVVDRTVWVYRSGNVYHYAPTESTEEIVVIPLSDKRYKRTRLGIAKTLLRELNAMWDKGDNEP